MSQHDYVIENQDGASFRADINNALAAIVSQNSGPTEPAAPYAFMLWQDTTAGVLKQRNALNTAWVALVDAIAVRPLTSGTSVATTSGTSIDFTNIPSWVKRITIAFNGVSTNAAGSGLPIVQLGKSAGIENTGYLAGVAVAVAGNGTGAATSTAGFPLVSSVVGTTTIHGLLTLVLADSATNTWVASYAATSSNAGSGYSGGGSKSLAGTLDRIRLTTSNGTDTFDAGLVNILYE